MGHIAERLRSLNSVFLSCGNDFSDVLLDAANEIERTFAELGAVRTVLNRANAMAMDCDPELAHYLDRACEHVETEYLRIRSQQ